MSHSPEVSHFLRTIAFQLLQKKRVTNQIAKLVPLYYPNGIYSELQICFMLGKRGGTEYIELFYIRAQKVSTFTHYLIEWYPFWELENPPVCFWVQTCVALKKRIFRFTDNISFLKSTFMYLNNIGSFVRLNLIPLLHIPKSAAPSILAVQALGCTILVHGKKLDEEDSYTSTEDKKPGLAIWGSAETATLSVETSHLLYLVHKELKSSMLTAEQKKILALELSRILSDINKQF